MIYLNYKYLLSVPMLFCMMSVTLMPLNTDKALAILASIFLLAKIKSGPRINIYILFILLSYLSLLIINFTKFSINTHHSLLFIFFLALSATFLSTMRAANENFLLLTFYYSLNAFIFVGVVFWILSHALNINLYVGEMHEKSDAGIKAAYSFTTTPQVFATYCALLTILAIRLKEKYIISKNKLTLSLALSFISIAISLNRVWIVFTAFILLYLLGFRGKILRLAFRSFISIFLFFTLLTFINEFPWQGFSTLKSRYDLFQLGLDFFLEQDLKTYLTGIPFYSSTYYSYHGRDFDIIENGYLFILINFGLIGIFLYLMLVSFVVNKSRKSQLIFIFSFYYLIIVPVFTHEFYSFSFTLSLAVIYSLWISDRRTHTKV